MNPGDLAPAALSFILTLLVFSYLWKDNPLFRLAVYLFVGVSAGYVGAVAFNNVILPQMVFPLIQVATGGPLEILFLAFPPLVLGLLLFAKLTDRLNWLGTPSMGFLVGVGAAAAIGGSVVGTLFPQIDATTDLFSFNSAIVLIGTLLTLFYFHFSVRADPDQPPERNPLIETLGLGGQVFIAITFGVLFAGVYAAALTALIERLNFLVNFIFLFF